MFSKAVVSASRLCFQPTGQVSALKLAQSRFSTSVSLAKHGPLPYGAKYGQVPKYLKEKMARFQEPNGIPVHLKGGLVDKVLYYITCGVCGVGFLECCRVFYILSYPPKK